DIENRRQLRPVTPGAETQQLRQAYICHHSETGKLALLTEAAELGLIDHRIARTLRQHRTQSLAVRRLRTQIQVGVVAAQGVRHRPRRTQRYRLARPQLLQFDANLAETLSYQQLRNAQVRIGETPQPQTGRGLYQTCGKVDPAGTQSLIERIPVRITTPA